jgi:hypothetical protein
MYDARYYLEKAKLRQLMWLEDARAGKMREPTRKWILEHAPGLLAMGDMVYGFAKEDRLGHDKASELSFIAQRIWKQERDSWWRAVNG